MPKLTHPDLPGVVIDVDDKKARVRRDGGWVDVDDVDGSPDGPDGPSDGDDLDGDAAH